MKVFSPFLNGNTTTSGSFNVPNHPSTASIQNPLTGSLFHDDTDGILKVYTGTQWAVVGEQAVSIPPAQADIEYLLVAGGASGGTANGGGGGAGGMLSSSLSSVSSGSSFTITVGAGGSGQVHSNIGNDGVDSSIAGSSITTITSIGGGGGGRGTVGNDGGSGGGGTYGSPGFAGGSGTTGQGNDGGDAIYTSQSPWGSGGGGGAEAEGGDSFAGGGGGAGGDGKQSNITGTLTYYAGGGGGGAEAGSTPTGGAGGGSNGAVGCPASSTAATANTGGGSGGGAGCGASTSGNGGSGVAIFAYDSGSIGAGGGIVGDAGNGRKYHQFNSTSTFKVGNTSDFQIHTSNLVMHVDASNFASRNGNTSGIDLSGYGNNLNLGGQSGGSLSNSFWWEGRSGGIADFERNGGSTASNVAHTGYGNMTGASTNAWTIEFWIKSTATGGNSTFGKTIIGTNSSSVWATISIKSNKFNYSHYDGSWLHEATTTSVNDGSWHHCVLVNLSNETCNMFVDGVKEVSASNSALDSGRYMKMDSLGRGYSSENTDMDIGQIRVYDATLTDAQILKNYNATKTNFV